MISIRNVYKHLAGFLKHTFFTINKSFVIKSVCFDFFFHAGNNLVDVYKINKKKLF